MKTGEYEKYSIHLFISKSEEMVFKKLIIVFVLCILIFHAVAIIKEADANNNNNNSSSSSSSSSSSNQVTIVPPGKVYATPPTDQDIISMCAGLKALLHSNEQIDKTIYSTFLKGYNTNCTTVLGRFHK